LFVSASPNFLAAGAAAFVAAFVATLDAKSARIAAMLGFFDAAAAGAGAFSFSAGTFGATAGAASS
jgi:hypothetical protein